VPLTLAGVFVIMLATGRDFDRITLGALILSLGLLVDDAIIIIETMVVKMEEGRDRIFAATYAWGHTAAPMLAGTLVTIIGLMPVGFAKSSAGEYAGNIFWVVAFALITSWFVAVIFTPYLGVKLLPNIKPVEGGHAAIYDTPRYRQAAQLIAWTVRNKKVVLGVVAALVVGLPMMGMVKQQFFPISDRPEVLVEVQMPEGTSIERDQRKAVAKVEAWLRKQPEAKIVTSYIGQGAPRFFLAMSPELPDPSFAKIVVLTPAKKARDALKSARAPVRPARAGARGAHPRHPDRLRPALALPGGVPRHGPGSTRCARSPSRSRRDARQHAMRQVNTDWGERVPTVHFVLDQDRLRAIGSELARCVRAAAVPADRRAGHPGARGHPHGRGGGPQRGGDRLDPAGWAPSRSPARTASAFRSTRSARPKSAWRTRSCAAAIV
jgi:multidrug efflux pump subunit AcrB